MDSWKPETNDHNLDFYKNLEIDPFRAFAHVGGFDTCIDLTLIREEIHKSNSILELGAGYGRCIEFLIKESFKGEVTAVEYCPHYYSYLKEKYGEIVNILNEDIKLLDLSIKADLALWMWSGIIDFSRAEQASSICKIYDILTKNGKLVIDLPKEGVKTIALHQDSKHLLFKTSFGNLLCYMPGIGDLEEYASLAQFSNLTFRHYTTTTNKERTLYILHK